MRWNVVGGRVLCESEPQEDAERSKAHSGVSVRSARFQPEADALSVVGGEGAWDLHEWYLGARQDPMEHAEALFASPCARQHDDHAALSELRPVGFRPLPCGNCVLGERCGCSLE